MSNDQVAQTRRTLKQMNDAADRAIDQQVSRSPVGPTDQVSATRRTLKQMNEAADRAIARVTRAKERVPKK